MRSSTLTITPSREFQHSLRGAIRKAFATELQAEKFAKLQQLCNGVGLSVDYSEYAWEHVAAYFLVNYVKVRDALRRSEFFPTPQKSLIVADLGAGAGASTVALCDYLRFDIGYKYPIRIYAVDHSKTQLDILKHLSVPHLMAMNVQVHTIKQDALTFLGRTDKIFSLCIASYLLSEINPEKRKQLYPLVHSRLASNIGVFLLIEQTNTRFGEECKSAAIWDDSNLFPAKKILMQASAGLKKNEKNRFSYLSACFEKSKKNKAVFRGADAPIELVKYKHAWEQRNLHAIKDLFHPQCAYTISGKRSMRGLPEVLLYWEWVFRTQRRIKFNPLTYRHIGNSILVEWTASFRRIDIRKTLSLIGCMRLDTKNERIVRLTEYYKRNEK